MSKDVSVIKQSNNAITAPRNYGGKELDLIRRTVAKDTTTDEFNMFIEICKRQGLDPFRRQVYALVFNKDDQKKRQVAFITGIDGYRAIAKRTGTYRPADTEPQFEYDKALVSDHNPRGIVKCSVAVYQYAVDGWYPVVGSARWDEFAPVYEEKVWQEVKDDQGNVVMQTEGRFAGSPKKALVPTGVKTLQKETWKTMPEIMLAKCAEAQALRKGWPEEMGGLYVQEELHVAHMEDMVASDMVDAYEQEKRERAVNAVDSVPCILNGTDGLQFIAIDKFADTVLDHLHNFESAEAIEFWMDQNKEALNAFWAKRKNDALGLKQEIEAKVQKLRAAADKVPDASAPEVSDEGVLI